MSLRACLPLLSLLAFAGCADGPDPVWTRSERLSLAAGKDFAACAAAAVGGVPGLTSTENPAMKAYFDDYLVLGGPPLASLHGVVGDLSLRGTTIQVELTSRRGKLPDEATRGGS
jgi:hypothetical protein